MLHEFGHFIFAKKFGMKVTEFFLGFGKRIWSFTRGETEFGLKAIPAGGYCRIVGMSAREELTPLDSPRAFYKASVPKRLIVLGAGSTFHFILGYILLFTLFAGVGVASLSSTIQEVIPCISTTTASCPAGTPPSPAFSAGLKSGDQILAINGKQVSNWPVDVLAIRNSPDTSITLTIGRSGEEIDIQVIPQAHLVNGKRIGMLGVINKIGMVTQGPVASAKRSAVLTRELFANSFSSLGALPSKIPTLISETFGGKARDPQGLVGVVGVAQASAQTVSNNTLSWRERFATFIMIIASLNIFVGIFNLLPLLPLDGGHMAVAIADGVRTAWARFTRKAAPLPIDVESLTPITVVVFILLAALSVLLLAADIFNPVHFNL